MKKVWAVVTATAAVVASAILAPPALARPIGPETANAKRPTFTGYEYQNYVAVPAQVSAAIVVPKLKCKKGPQRDIEPGSFVRRRSIRVAGITEQRAERLQPRHRSWPGWRGPGHDRTPLNQRRDVRDRVQASVIRAR